MLVSDLVNQYHNSLNAGSKIAKKTKGVEQLVKTVSSMEKGQVFEGTVQRVKGDKVTLALSSGQNITARLDRSIDLKEGESVFFQVKSNEGGTVQIRPVTSEFGGNPTLLNALKNAGLPENETNLKLVNAMMKEQMPIDKDSIKDMMRTVRNFPNADIDTLVSMKKLDLPVSDGMITQFENYKQSEGEILKMVGDLAGNIKEALSGENVTKEDALNFQKELLDMILPEKEEASGEAKVIQNNLGQKPEAEPNVAAGNGPIGNVTEEGAKTLVKDNLTGEILEKPVPGMEGQSQTAPAGEGVPARVDEAANDTSHLRAPQLNKNALINILEPQELVELTKTLKSVSGFKEAIPQAFDENGNIRPEIKGQDLLKAVTSLVSANPNATKSDLLNFLDSAPAKHLVNHFMEEAWTMEPKEFSKKGAIDKLYQKIEEDMERLVETSKRTSHNPANPIAETASSVKDNLSFIREVNQIYQYVQIPLQMSGQKATGDLYVYTNKKNKRQENDEITAFLHFDMDNLGSTDISVKLKGKSLDTKFFMEDDISFQLIQNNLHSLQEKLEGLGFTCNLQVENDSKQVNFVEDFLKQDVKTAGPIKRYSFDVRA